ncbi:MULTISPECIES: hypothetical protein [unclassified Spiroplasma]|uniref:hypothetical protein n=1 Tax=unclassified Spiroplasma TaxID=2637901 RepID=UPI0030CBC052
MVKEKMLSATKLIKKLESIKLKYQKQHNTQIPYFKRIIEELKGIFLVADIPNVIKNLKYLQYNCGKSTKKYSDKAIMPILSLFTVTISFLEAQANKGTLSIDFKNIYKYDLSNVLTTSEDKLFVLGLQTDLEVEIKHRDSSKSLDDLTLYDSSDISEIFKEMQEKIHDLKILKEAKNKICGQINNFNLNFKNEKQLSRRWWHWPLKFLTCGMWESNKIKAINNKYSKDSFDKLICEHNGLNTKINKLESDIEILKTKVNKLEKKTKILGSSSLNYGKKWKSINDLDEHNIVEKSFSYQNLL